MCRPRGLGSYGETTFDKQLHDNTTDISVYCQKLGQRGREVVLGVILSCIIHVSPQLQQSLFVIIIQLYIHYSNDKYLLHYGNIMLAYAT